MVRQMAKYIDFSKRKVSIKSKHSPRRNYNRNAENVSKSEKLMNGISTWASYYRLYPHVFVKDYFGVNLKLFQSIILYFMMHDNYVMYIAARG